LQQKNVAEFAMTNTKLIAISAANHSSTKYRGI
jgi:hypothetical protein